MLSKKEFTIFSWWFLLGDTGLLLPSGSDWNLHFWLSCNQAFKLQIFGLLSLHNFMSQLLISSLSVCLSSICLSVNLSCAPAQSLSHIWLFVIPWTVACQFSLCMEFSRQEYWSGCHFLHQGIFLTQGLNPTSGIGRQILYHWATRKTHLSSVYLSVYHPIGSRFLESSYTHGASSKALGKILETAKDIIII